MAWQSPGDNLPTHNNPFTRFLGRALFKILGWRVVGSFPNRSKLIVAVAPHTSNIDFMLTIAVIWSTGLRASYLAKHSLFKFPLGPIMRYFGGIPVDRDSTQGIVEQMAAQFESRKKLVLGITPEGTRSKVRHWKKGFALIAARSDVPVLPAILDLQNKIVRFEPLITQVRDPDRVIDAMQQLVNQVNPRLMQK